MRPTDVLIASSLLLTRCSSSVANATLLSCGLARFSGSSKRCKACWTMLTVSGVKTKQRGEGRCVVRFLLCVIVVCLSKCLHLAKRPLHQNAQAAKLPELLVALR